MSVQANKPNPPSTKKPDDRGVNVEKEKKESPGTNPFHFNPGEKREQPERADEIYEESLPPETRVQ